MTYLKLIKHIEDIVTEKKLYFKLGYIYSINFESNKYPLVNLYIENVNISGRTNTYNVLIYYIDRLTKNNSNLLQIHNNGIVYLTEILNSIEPASVSNITANLFDEDSTFGDRCAGVYIRASIEIINPVGVCVDY